MLFDPTERNVNPFPFLARVRPMKELILAFAIHDKNVTMAKSAKVSFIVPQHTKASPGEQSPLHTLASSGQHRSIVRGPIAGPCPYAYEQVHEEPQGPTTLCGTIPSLPSLPLRKGKKEDSLLKGTPEQTIPQTELFSPT